MENDKMANNMKRRGLRIWLLMVVVALVALSSAVRVFVRRSAEYAERAATHETRAVMLTFNTDYARREIEWSKEQAKLASETLVDYKRILSGLEGTSAPSDGTDVAMAVHGAAEETWRQKLAASEANTRYWESRYRIAVASISEERLLAGRWRRAAHYPWLGAPSVQPK
jgi:hypothetical protein